MPPCAGRIGQLGNCCAVAHVSVCSAADQPVACIPLCHMRLGMVDVHHIVQDLFRAPVYIIDMADMASLHVFPVSCLLLLHLCAAKCLNACGV